jgi:hypothetical protein
VSGFQRGEGVYEYPRDRVAACFDGRPVCCGCVQERAFDLVNAHDQNSYWVCFVLGESSLRRRLCSSLTLIYPHFWNGDAFLIDFCRNLNHVHPRSPNFLICFFSQQFARPTCPILHPRRCACVSRFFEVVQPPQPLLLGPSAVSSLVHVFHVSDPLRLEPGP